MRSNGLSVNGEDRMLFQNEPIGIHDRHELLLAFIDGQSHMGVMILRLKCLDRVQ